MTACHACGSSARLRFERASGVWMCVDTCGTERAPKRSRRFRRPPLFEGWVREDGIRRRASREELREAARLYYEHTDVRQGQRA
jgi:hypothetical protein